MNAALTDLEQQQASLAQVQLDDFRASSLFEFVGKRTIAGSVLDVGCGGGGMVAWLLRRGYDARGVDSSPSTIRAAKAFLSGLGLDPSAVSSTAIETLVQQGQQADNVISMDCLEHIEDDSAAFANLVRLVKPNGRLIVTVPALAALYGDRDRKIGHYRRYSPARLRSLTASQPIRVDDLRYWNMLGVAPTFASHRILNRAVNESFRYGNPSPAKRALRQALGWWFRRVENQIRPPLGLTLVMTARRL
ncbi:MAG TPA: methyltransferase domain-containing protein [Polyangiaceae bacterium]|nr:methyltransferase domain-containing protein [Polyangiaceae bacterium]